MLKTHQHEGNQLPFMISSIISSINLMSKELQYPCRKCQALETEFFCVVCYNGLKRERNTQKLVSSVGHADMVAMQKYIRHRLRPK